MASRPRTGRGTTGRDSSKDVDVEADLLARVIEGIKKAQGHHDRQRELGAEIMALEEEMKSGGKNCLTYPMYSSACSTQIRSCISKGPLNNACLLPVHDGHEHTS